MLEYSGPYAGKHLDPNFGTVKARLKHVFLQREHAVVRIRAASVHLVFMGSPAPPPRYSPTGCRELALINSRYPELNLSKGERRKWHRESGRETLGFMLLDYATFRE